MKNALLLAVLCCLAVSSYAATWTIQDYLFASIAVDVAYVNETTSISAVVTFEGEASVLWTVNGGSNWGPVYQYDGFRMYSGCAASNNPNQSAVVADIFSFQYSDTEQFLFTGSQTPGGFKSQTVDNFGDGWQGDGVSYASVGMRWEDASNGVMVSRDQGHKFEFYNISDLKTWARYGAFPSDQVWYVTAGHWPNDNSPPLTDPEMMDEYSISSMLSYKRDAFTKQFKNALKKPADFEQKTDEVEPIIADDEEVIPPPGWNAQIVKTTDGGNTWVSQYYNTSYFYFNQITCATETHCVTVGESQTRPGKGKPKVPGIHIFLTTDGTHWNEVFFQEAEWMSIFAVTFVTPNVVWASGADLGSDPIRGFFWVSRDGGKTWKIDTEIKNVYPIQLSFLDSQNAWAVGPNDAQSSALMKFA